MLRWLTILAVLGAGGATMAAELVESTFQVKVTRNGETAIYTDTTVPYLPDSACYSWYAKFDSATTGELTLVETLTLPEPLAARKDHQNDPASTTQIAPDAQTAVTTVTGTLVADSWLSHGWCVDEGDPLGAHSIALTLDGTQVAGWDVTVVAEADYPFAPAADAQPSPEPSPPVPPSLPLQPSPTARDVNQSW